MTLRSISLATLTALILTAPCAAQAPAQPASGTAQPALVPKPNSPVDPAVKATNFDVSRPADPSALEMRSKIDLSRAKNAGLVAARVGDSVITVQQVVEGMRERLKDAPPEQANDPRVRLQVAPVVLDDLIDQAIVLNEAKARFAKKKDTIKTFNQMTDAKWKEEELPPLLRKYKVENEYALKRVLALENKNIDDLKEAYRRQTMFVEFLVVSVRPKLNVSYPEMLKYYNAHLNDYKLDASITWREIAIDFNKNATPALAKAKAETIRESLARGAEFASLANSQSDGPTAKQGGKWETAPGSIAEPAIAQALEILPLNEVSPILTGKSGYHIVVVESRRAAGIARFDEVQDKIREKVFDQKKKAESDAFIKKLSAKTMVFTTVPGSRYATSAAKNQ